ncbi:MULTISPECIES: hypothetical protein [Streptomyces]|nr:hypothetical protein [Streptomyces sp. AK02-04a]MDX3758162.1 hypothetical protein [Streptomyces sp. AK02-04a]
MASRTPQYNAGNEAAKFQAVFSITSPPTLDAAVPAASGGGG